jgi:hypothetical protein
MTRRRVVMLLAVVIAASATVPAWGGSTTLSRLAKRVTALTGQVRDVREKDIQTTTRLVLAQQDPSGAATATAKCPRNWSATGGGSDWIGPAFAADTVIFSRPVGSPPTAWEVAAHRGEGVGASGSTLEVYVVCARFS